MRNYLIILFIIFTSDSFSQNGITGIFLADTSLKNGSVSICIKDPASDSVILEYDSFRSLAPASVLKLVTSACAIELLGADYTFTTTIGYNGSLNTKNGVLTGDIIIKGGGDPALGSDYFSEHYNDFTSNWVNELRKAGIKRVTGRVITDDTWFDYKPVPSTWLWEDIGNYYGAGVYGLSVFENYYKIHFSTLSDGTKPEITGIEPAIWKPGLINYLTASGTTDKGYIFSSPYNNSGWIAGTIPVNTNDFVLKAAVTDPPLLIATILNQKLEENGIEISGNPSTYRAQNITTSPNIVKLTETVSPTLSEIIGVLNRESVNLFAETLVKELGRKFRGTGSTEAGLEVINDFYKDSGIDIRGVFIKDGSGLSPQNAICARNLVDILSYMQKKGKFFNEFYSSLPAAGKEGTLHNVFTDPLFTNRLRAKSGTLSRVRNYAGYFSTVGGKKLVFAILVNNYSGTTKTVVTDIEKLISEIITM